MVKRRARGALAVATGLAAGLLATVSAGVGRARPRAFPITRSAFTLRPAGTDVRVYALRVDLSDPRVRLRVTAPDEGPAATSVWARRTGVWAAINGDYFTPAPSVPTGPARGRGTWWPSRDPIHHDGLLLVADARVTVRDAPRSPALWEDARTTVGPETTEVLALREHVLHQRRFTPSAAITGPRSRHPRSALGFSADGRTLWLLATRADIPEGRGLTTEELADALRRAGAAEGYKLDGGSSCTLWSREEGLINRRTGETAVAVHLGVFVR